MIVALGRTAGSAVTRSRVRRIARNVFTAAVFAAPVALQLLLFVRKDVRDRPRRGIREDLQNLLARVPDALRRREARAAQHALAGQSGPFSA